MPSQPTKTAAVLQARMSSTRLPGKVLRPILGQPMIARQIERLRRCEHLDQIIVATSTDPSDEPLAEAVRAMGVPVHRGDLDDVLGRFIGAADAFGLEGIMVRLTADCPLADPGVIDQAIALRARDDLDYLSNGRQRTYPRGVDVEVFRIDALRAAAREADTPYDREHVTPYLYKPGARFTQGHLTQARDESDLRWTVDYPDDFAFVERVYAALYPTNPAFTSDDIRALPFTRREADV